MGEEASRRAVLFFLILACSTLTPAVTLVGGQDLSVAVDDFGIIASLHDVLSSRKTDFNDPILSSSANAAIEDVRSSMHDVSPQDSFNLNNNVLSDVNFTTTNLSQIDHPYPYRLLSEPDARPPYLPASLIETLLPTELNELVVFSDYTSRNGAINCQNYSSEGLLNFDIFPLDQYNPTVNTVDIDCDGIDDVNVGLGLGIANSPGQTWDIDILEAKMWVKPDIRVTIDPINSSRNVWSQMGRLEISVMKGFTYSDQTWVWVIDTRFTQIPEDAAVTVGLERVDFDLNPTSILGMLIPSTTGLNDADLTITGIRAPYAITVENPVSTSCDDRWLADPDTQRHLPSPEIDCGIAAGLGYVHYRIGSGNSHPIAEMAYVDASFHPAKGTNELASVYNLTIRNDDYTLDTTPTDGSWDSIEYYANQKADLYLHYHEDRSGLTRTDGSGEFGNTTEARGWLRGLPGDSFNEQEIDRLFRQIGASPDGPTPLPGSLPKNLGMFIGVKNWTADPTRHDSDPSLPIDPANPPDSLIMIATTESIESINYSSWLLRSGDASDHLRVTISIEDLPKVVIVSGSLEFEDSDEDDVLGFGDSLNIAQSMIDTVVVTVVDVILKVGEVVNSLPAIAIDLSGDASGGELQILTMESLASNRPPDPIGSISLQIGSSPHPTIGDEHLLISRDLGLFDSLMALNRTPILSVAASLKLRGFHSMNNLVESNGDRAFNLSLSGSSKMVAGHIQHMGKTLNGSVRQEVILQPLPSEIGLKMIGNQTIIELEDGIDAVAYASVEGDERVSVQLLGVPSGINLDFSNGTELSLSSPLTTFEVMATNLSTPRTFSGDHVLIERNGSKAGSSARLSGIESIAWVPAEIPDAPGPSGRELASIHLAGNRALKAAIIDDGTSQSSQKAEAFLRINPLPTRLDVRMPRSSEGSSVTTPDFGNGVGLVGISNGLLDLARFGRSINDVLGEFTHSISTTTTESDHFGLDVEIDTDAPFDLAAEFVIGDLEVEEPPWVQGISIEAKENSTLRSMHGRVWLPSLSPNTTIEIVYDNTTGISTWSVDLSMASWIPTHDNLALISRGIEGMDLELVVDGLDTNTSGDLRLEMLLEQDASPSVPVLSVVLDAELPSDAETIHLLNLNRAIGQRLESLIVGAPQKAALTMTIGSAIELDVDVPPEARTDGRAAEAMLLQTHRFAEERWWPATIMMRDIPGEITLSTVPLREFDISQDLSFQGMATLDYRSCWTGVGDCRGDDLDLYIEATGRAIDQRGDILLIGENLARLTRLSSTTDWGMSLVTSEKGVERIYIRSTDLPLRPGMWLNSAEIVGENIRSATVHIDNIGNTYPIIRLTDVSAGRIVAISSVDVDIAGRTFNGKAVLVDAQIAGIMPIGTTLGLNGLAADLSVIGTASGDRIQSTHFMFVEPLSSLIATLVATAVG